MICETSSEDFFESLQTGTPFPVSASLELTARCNLSCAYCYMVSYRDEPELSTGEVFSILEDLARAGCLTLLITGGEPLLRQDFPEIWRKAKSLGFLLHFYSNATLVDERIVDLFRELPPLLTEVTLYGASSETYAAFTGKSDAFDQAVRGIELLKTCVGAFHIKAPVLKQNQHELEAMSALSETWDLKFYFDAEVFPRLNGDRAPLQSALSMPEAVERVKDDAFHREVWEREFKNRGRPSRIDKTVMCNGGRSSVHIGPYGDLCMCMLLRDPSFSLRTGSFEEGWDFIHNTVREKPCNPGRVCNACETIQYCQPCAGKNQFATGDPDVPFERTCEEAKALEKLFEEIKAHDTCTASA